MPRVTLLKSAFCWSPSLTMSRASACEILRSARKASNCFLEPAKFSLVMRARSASISASVTSQGVPQSRASKSMIRRCTRSCTACWRTWSNPSSPAAGRVWPEALASALRWAMALSSCSWVMFESPTRADDAVGQVRGVPATAGGDEQDAHDPGDDEGGGDPRSAR